MVKSTPADSVINEIFKLYMGKSIKQSKCTKPYSRQIMIFCMTLAGYSARAYSFLRDVANKCLPSQKTLRNYRKRVDGSPGFSAAALQMIKRKVAELEEKSRQLFVSISCDDMSIRYIFYLETFWHSQEQFTVHKIGWVNLALRFFKNKSTEKVSYFLEPSKMLWQKKVYQKC